MNVRDTSQAARRQAEDSGAITAGCRRIMVWFHGQPAGTDATRSEIARSTGMPLQTVCARIRDILDDPRPFLEELSARACKVTGNSSHPLRIPVSQAAGQAPSPGKPGDSGATSSCTGSPGPAASAPVERLIYDADGKPFYTAVGYGPGWPVDQDHLHRRAR